MKDVIFTNVMFLGNAGDFWCSPTHYYDFSFVNCHKIHYMDIFRGVSGKAGYEKYKYKDQILVIGGGGLITSPGNFLQDTLEYLVENNKVILWGIGSNTFNTFFWDFLNSPNVLLAGIRDTAFQLNTRYLPCVSCKNKLFDKTYTYPSGIGVIEHASGASILIEEPTVKNSDTIENIVDLISSSESIVSNTYHGIYWSQLMGKKVVCYQEGPSINNSKIINLRHRVLSCDSSNYRDILSITGKVDGYLQECRYLNDWFYNDVVAILEGL